MTEDSGAREHPDPARAPQEDRSGGRFTGAFPSTDPTTGPAPFFAQLRAFTLECPRCAYMWQVPTNAKSCWDAAHSYFRCKECGLVLILGVIAHRVRSGNRYAPRDHVPTVEQSMKIRRLGAGLLSSRRIAKKAEANRVDECTCVIVMVDPEKPCPVHES